MMLVTGDELVGIIDAEIDRLLATLDAPQPGTVEVTDDDLEKVGKELERSRRLPAGRMGQRVEAPQQQAPEPSADARAWLRRTTEAAMAWGHAAEGEPSATAWRKLLPLLDEAVAHWADATCTGCAAADQRAERAENQRNEAFVESDRLRKVVKDREQQIQERDQDIERNRIDHLEVVEGLARLLAEANRG